ncbi:MAG: hypothetical protein HY011_01195 [Acidobacteria bacterium]|nr:hypothetical protein [Acidobacteriota bacterium]
MKEKCQRFILGLALLEMTAWTVCPQNPPQTGEAFFENKIRPLLATECFSCHTYSALGGLRLDSRAALLRGGKSGPAIVPGEPDKSLLVIALRQTGALKMPKGGKLPQAQIDAVAEWIRAGAVWPVAGWPQPVAKGELTIPARRAFWSFQPFIPFPRPS